MLLIAALYRFHAIEECKLEAARETLLAQGQTLGIRGLLILGVEGINGTVCGDDESLNKFCDEVGRLFGIPDLKCKKSRCHFSPFAKLKVQIRSEIVTAGDPTLDPKLAPGTHLTPTQWHRTLQTDRDAVVLDTRNWYETKLGKFRHAIDPKLNSFQEFSEFLPKSGIDKDKKVLIYCTGGIRCEKAIVEMHRQGFKNVFQLEGGILKYLEEYPSSEFEGECFVFDYRVAVDQDLKPTNRYKLCPHCGQPADIVIHCAHCNRSAVVCEHCVHLEGRATCSKNCAHHHRMGHRFRGGKGSTPRTKDSAIRPSKVGSNSASDK